ncbi:MAG: DNA replication/repair protein RecF [Patescibacteria group bacterium]|jgi:DNA replication and repair protein RecF|nr:DNA replication/repair protein RecF [Patescibacteria group bacterium]
MNSIITSLHLVQYRSYEDFAVELSPTVNIIVGPNASGKTNLLEAVLLLCGSSPFRAGVSDLIMYDKPWARIVSIMKQTERSVTLERGEYSVKRQYTIKGEKRQRLRFEDTVPVVLFEPEHMRLLTGSPERRREFLDEILSAIDPQYYRYKKQYTRALAQRNSLLKNYSSNQANQLFIWNIRLSELAGYIVQERIKLLAILQADIGNLYSNIAGNKTKVDINYITPLPTDNYESVLLGKLEQSLDGDIAKGFTSYGPHRDDLDIKLSGKTAKGTASRGETRTMVLALKLLQVKLIESHRKNRPIILLDDVFSELDGSRRKALTNYLDKQQAIITTTDADVVSKDFAQHTNTISLQDL